MIPKRSSTLAAFAVVIGIANADSGALAAGRAPAVERDPSGRVVGLTAPAQRLNDYQRRLLSGFLAGAAGAPDTLRVVAFQVQFADSLMGGQPGSNRPALRDSTWFANELIHMGQYFDGASRGRTSVQWTLDGELYSLPKSMRYYGNDTHEETRVVELVQTLVGLADAKIDFSSYDHVFVIHAGAGQETDLFGDSRGQIWSSFYDQSDVDDGLPDSLAGGIPTGDIANGAPHRVTNFSIVPSDASQDFSTIGTLGIWAFEVGSRLGLLPMFDSTPAGVPDSQGLGNFCLMAYGIYNVNGFVPAFPCEFNRVLAGWVDPVIVDATASPRTISLADINTGADTDTLCMKIPITESEYFLVDNRVHDANFDSLFTFADADSDLVPDNTESLAGAEFDFFLTDLTNPTLRRFSSEYGFDVLYRHTGSGIYVWHVDENVIREAIGRGFLPDDFVSRKGVDLEEADGVQDLDGGGAIGFVLGSFFDSYRAGDGNQTSFGASTKPNSNTNDGVRTGITIENISAPGFRMTVTLRRDIGYTETRTRFDAETFGQPATVVDVDGVGAPEVVALADSSGVYLFNAAGAEYVDTDADPATVLPFIAVPAEAWSGPPAFADIDGGGDVEIIAAARSGRLYAWKSDGAEVVDGDGDAGTTGVLRAGLPLAAPPMVVNLLASAAVQIVSVEQDGDSLQVGFVGANGASFVPADPAFAPLWPLRVAGQYAAALAFAGTGNTSTPAKEGIVIVSVDTLAARVHVAYAPAMYRAGAAFTGQPTARTWRHSFPVPPPYRAADYRPSSPAVADFDGDGSDEIVFTTPDGAVHIYDNKAGETGVVAPTVTTLRGSTPTAPALGDVDGDGSVEIALWDSDYMYLLKSNGRVATNWPLRIASPGTGEQPPRTVRRGRESPVVADVDGDGRVDVVFPLEEGAVRAFDAAGTSTPGFPRPAPSGAPTPTVASLGGGTLSLVTLGTAPVLRGIDSVIDSVDSPDVATLSIQSLAATPASRLYWPAWQGGIERQGRSLAAGPLVRVAEPFDRATFMVYPNPVFGDEVHARVMLNAAATVTVTVYTVEGQETWTRVYTDNAGGVAATPFDEIVDVSSLKSGIYLMRLRIETSRRTESIVKTFAVRR